jgi:hypothetical protein
VLVPFVYQVAQVVDPSVQLNQQQNFATKRYGGADERDAVESFIADLSASQEMDQQTVPPDMDTSSIDEDIV